ncbi:MAG: hypothetical protein CR982_04655 [Candidatus Cloacimonadota bacterium]|nr:MAG: hypothetical protein CR982_04655 [Candidatus Cloacimonadota bacterium]PIE77971.1 MAG: hypothetical protein CSA15_10220 [Candidatus Delongbacteria bacterium]
MSLQNIKDKYGDQVEIYSANQNIQFDYEYLNGREWRLKYGLTYNISNYYDMGEIERYFTKFSTPMTVIIGKDMRVRFSHFGYISEDSIETNFLLAHEEFTDITTIKQNEVLPTENSININLDNYFKSISNSTISYEVINSPKVHTYNLDGSNLEIEKSTGGYDSISVEVSTDITTETYQFYLKSLSSTDYEKFDSGEFSEEWNSFGNEIWSINEDFYFDPPYSAVSGKIESTTSPDSITFTSLELERYYSSSGYISFMYRVSSELNEDSLSFFVNDEEIDIIDDSGEVLWKYILLDVDEGDNIFKWRYNKSPYYETGDDFAAIDHIEFRYTTSVSENSIDDSELINIYPSPFNSTTNIEFNSSLEDFEFKIFNSSGIEIYSSNSKKVNNNRYIFKAEDLSSGVYYVQIMSNNNKIYLKKMLFLK